jgi:hypothetical protein
MAAEWNLYLSIVTTNGPRISFLHTVRMTNTASIFEKWTSSDYELLKIMRRTGLLIVFNNWFLLSSSLYKHTEATEPEQV